MPERNHSAGKKTFISLEFGGSQSKFPLVWNLLKDGQGGTCAEEWWQEAERQGRYTSSSPGWSVLDSALITWWWQLQPSNWIPSHFPEAPPQALGLDQASTLNPATINPWTSDIELGVLHVHQSLGSWILLHPNRYTQPLRMDISLLRTHSGACYPAVSEALWNQWIQCLCSHTSWAAKGKPKVSY